jgi:hypothetical protein
MLAIWHAIVLIAREVPTGGTEAVTAVAAELSGKAMLSIVRWSNLCKNCPAVLQVRTASLLAASRPVPTTVTMTVTRSHGSAALLPAMWLPGSREGGTTALATTTDPAIRAVHLRGQDRAVAAIMDTDRMQVATVPLVLLLLLVALLLGTSKLRLHHPAEQVLMDMGLIPVMAQLCLVWAPRVLLRV